MEYINKCGSPVRSVVVALLAGFLFDIFIDFDTSIDRIKPSGQLAGGLLGNGLTSQTTKRRNRKLSYTAVVILLWSVIACHLPGRTDNEIKNYWNSHLSRKIYRFYKHGTEPKPPSKSVVKLTSPNKQRAGRVSRTVAKKFNKKRAPSVKLSTTEPAASEAQNRTKAITINPMIGVFNQQEEESRSVAVDNDSCKASTHLCPAGGEEDKENEVLDPYNYEELEQHIAELNYILESGVEESCGNLRLDMETVNAFMGAEEMIVNDHEIMEKISGDGSSSLSDSTREVGYAMNSCFHEDEWFDWGLEAGPVGELTVPWDEGEDMLPWLWDSGIHELGDFQYY